MIRQMSADRWTEISEMNGNLVLVDKEVSCLTVGNYRTPDRRVSPTRPKHSQVELRVW